MDWAAKKEAVDQDDSARPSGVLPPSIYSETDVSQVNPKGMRQWWQSYNITSLDGLPSFSKNFGLQFPFVFSLGRLRASKIHTQAKSKPSPSSSPGAQGRLSLDSEESIPTIRSSHYLCGVTDESYSHYRRLISFTFLISPYVITLLIGILLGRFYEQYRRSYGTSSNFRQALSF